MEIKTLLEMAKEHILLISAIVAAIPIIMEAVAESVKPFTLLIKWATKRWGSNTPGKLEELTKCVSGLTSQVQCVQNNVECVSRKVDQNEQDRLRASITRYLHIARDKKPISDAEWLGLEADWGKYMELKGNHETEKTWDFIKNYYMNKGWEKPRAARSATKGA